MPKKPSHPKADDKEQSRAFIEKAREIEADEENSAAEELLGRLAKMPPEQDLSLSRAAGMDRVHTSIRCRN
jgi:hypothetical protein